MPKTDFEELLMVYTRLYKISQVYKVNQRRQSSRRHEEEQQQQLKPIEQVEEKRKFYL